MRLSGRIGGDEFVVFMGNIEDDEATLHKAKALIEALSTAYVDGYCHISIWVVYSLLPSRWFTL